MNKITIPYLCGATFFFLLLNARHKKSTPREHKQGVNDGLADSYIMDWLVYVVTGNHNCNVNSSLRKETSKYREGCLNASINIPFNDPATIGSFKLEISSNYHTILKRMTAFLETCIDPQKQEWLVKVLLETIILDKKIPDNQDFYIQQDLISTPKNSLLSLGSYELQPFLIGIILYILENRQDNSLGKSTLEAWGKKAGTRSERKLTNSHLGTSIQSPIAVVLVQITEPDISTESEETTVETDTNNSETIEPEILSDTEQSSETQAEKESANDSKTTIIKHQTNVVQNGNNNVNLVINGKATINL